MNKLTSIIVFIIFLIAIGYAWAAICYLPIIEDLTNQVNILKFK